jgi:hypothetical protein
VALSDYRADLLNSVATRASVDKDYMAGAFLSEVADRLAEAEEIDNLVGVHFRGEGARGKHLAVDGYDLGDADDSVALAVTHYVGSDDTASLTETEAKRALASLTAYLHDSVHGTFMVDREESDPAYQLAVDLQARGQSVTRYRLYLFTDAQLSGRGRHLPNSDLKGVPVEHHVWDIQRLEQLQLSKQGREELEIDLTEWVPEGLPVLELPGDAEFVTYLAAVPGRVIADLYARHGSRLLESNVRSFLSGRGKVNKGIRTTVLKEPSMFLAFNNGITATATGVGKSATGSVLTIKDLQIVNGGQTTASLFYVRRESSPKIDLEQIHVQMKLVVVDQDKAKELVPSISRYANSQNRVSDADFFSNSPFHVRMENISRRLLAPAKPGVHFQTKWFYERTRGQYLNEQAKMTPGDQKKFEATLPRNQVITKTDAAKYEVSWDQKPHMVSAGAQRNFVAFAESVAAKWESSDAEFNESYFKSMVAKAILFQSIRAAVAKKDWYQSGYLANIVAYAMAKISREIQRQAIDSSMNFPEIWNLQRVPQPVLDTALRAAKLAFDVLTEQRRPVQNVTEWAKRQDCWRAMEAVPMPLDPTFLETLLSNHTVREERQNSRTTQKIDSGIEAQAAVFNLSQDTWEQVRVFGMQARILSPTDIGILDLVTGRKSGFPSERQSARLLQVLSRANDHGLEMPD